MTRVQDQWIELAASYNEHRGTLGDALENPLPGLSGDAAAIVKDSGVLTPVRWPHHAQIPADTGPVRLQISFEGSQRDQIKLYAVYIDPA